MDHCWTYRSPPESRSKWLSICRFDNGAEVDPQLAVCDLHNSSLDLFSEEGHCLHHIIPSSTHWRPCSVAQGVGNALGVCDWTSKCLRLLTLDYRPSYQRSERLGRAHLRQPYSAAMTTVGNWVVVDSEDVVVLSPFGSLITRISLSSDMTNGKKWAPRHVTTDKQQRIYISDPEGGLVCIFDAAGRFIRKISRMTLRYPCGLLVNDLDQLLVCDQERGCVSLFDSRGSFLYDIITRKTLPQTYEDELPIATWRPVSITSTTPGQVCLAAAYENEFVIQCFAYDFMPSSARSAH